MTHRPRILVVDDEEAILETMAFTFEDGYEVLTASDARRALELLDEHAPVAAVLSDQRMPNMSGVDFVAEVWRRHPATVRMILTGFSDMDAIIKAVNDGHIYAYVTKPWEPDQLKQLMKQAVEHYQLTVENERLLASQQRANLFLAAVMDQLDTGAVALDAEGVVQAINRPARDYLGIDRDLRGLALEEVLGPEVLAAVGGAVVGIADGGGGYEEIEVPRGERLLRLRVTTKVLGGEDGNTIGRVILLTEISHEPLERRFNELLREIVQCEGRLRPVLEAAQERLRQLFAEVDGSSVASASMGELGERISRTLTAAQNWLDVDDALVQQDFPDAQLLQARMRVSLARWPLSDELPSRVRDLARRVEEYYESGENPKKPVL